MARAGTLLPVHIIQPTKTIVTAPTRTDTPFEVRLRGRESCEAALSSNSSCLKSSRVGMDHLDREKKGAAAEALSFCGP